MIRPFTILTAVSILLLVPGASPSMTADQIMKKVRALKKPSTVKQTSALLIIKEGRRDVYYFSGIYRDYGSESRMRITFKKGSRMEFLVVNRKGKGSRQWLKLSNGKIRQVPRGEKGASWLNSHFYNVDIGGGTTRNAFSYRLLGSVKVDGIDCYRIIGKGDPDGVYSSSIIYAGKSDYVIRKVELYEKGRHTKTLIMQKIQKVSGIYTPRKITMERADGRGKSIFYIKSIQYNVPVKDYRLRRAGF